MHNAFQDDMKLSPSPNAETYDDITSRKGKGKKKKTPLVNADAAALPDLDWDPLRLDVKSPLQPQADSSSRLPYLVQFHLNVVIVNLLGRLLQKTTKGFPMSVSIEDTILGFIPNSPSSLSSSFKFDGKSLISSPVCTSYMGPRGTLPWVTDPLCWRATTFFILNVH